MSPGALCPACGVAALIEAADGGMECSDETCGARHPASRKDRIGQLLVETREQLHRAHARHHPTDPKNQKRANR